MAEYRVLVFGSTGTGKTSLCNELTKGNREANSSVRGNTFETYTYPAVTHDGDTYIITDTVGLNETDKGTVSGEKAIEELISLLVEAKEGFNLLIHVFKIPRITNAHEANYDFFVSKMTNNRIPTILVATGCENESPMSAWVDSNRSEFEKDGYDYKEIVATCFAKGGPLEETYAPLRRISTKSVFSSIKSHGLEEAAKLYGEGGPEFIDIFASIWNAFVDWANLPAKYRKKINESGYDLLIRVGVPQPVALAAVTHLPELAMRIARSFLPPWVSAALELFTTTAEKKDRG